MKAFSMPDESMSTLLQYVGATLAGLTVVVGLWAVIVGNRISDTQKVEIAKARKEAASAIAEAAKSAEEIAALNKQAESLKLEAAEARREIATAQAEAAKATEGAALANEKAETLKAESVALQRILRPRLLYSNPEWVEPLKPFHGMHAIIFVFPDSEAQVFANSIASVLTQAGWVPEMRVSDSVFRGLSIFSGTWPEEGSPPDRAWMAGEALAELVGKEFAATETGPRLPITHGPEKLRPPEWSAFARPAGVVVIEVGMMPMHESLMLLKNMKGVYTEGPPPERPRFKP
jgi:hypothetical protein